MNSKKKMARVSGLLYLIIVLTGIFSLMYVPGKLIVHGDASATAKNILASQLLFRANILNSLVSPTVFLFLALALYLLLKEVNHLLSVLMVILVMIQIPIAFIDVLNQLAALELVRGADFLSVFSNGQREVLALLFLRINDQGTIASELFWGLWLFPLGLLVYRSGFLPKFLGAWLIINGFAYVATCFVGLLLPQYLGVTNKIAFPLLLGEVAFMLWLLVMGAKTIEPEQRAAA